MVEDGKIIFDNYKKPTNSGRFLNFTSNHSVQHTAKDNERHNFTSANSFSEKEFKIISPVHRLGIDYRMPDILEPGQFQLSTEIANDSRLITKTRWIVEARNGHLKSFFKFFRNIIPFHHVNHLQEFYLIGGAIIKKYREPIYMEGATIELTHNMLERTRTPNALKDIVEREGLDRRGFNQWIRLDENQLLDFPILDIDYLQDLTVAIYQIGLAFSYVQDKIMRDDTEILELDLHRVQPNILRLRVYSRHKNRTRYNLNDDIVQGADIVNGEPILGYYCAKPAQER
ncbi:hypothetical protein ALC57_12725 [Trachymyrmex cornetzi]|uniref:DDE Tnp4 domain-containing protein n=1 Tax=Trachymyrmex cornetzi TaxID=471704 RepID=A0A151J0S6_9HYME|nr:hypothetical protein ALC57_12725 [Trachymyrmex cornetzi]